MRTRLEALIITAVLLGTAAFPVGAAGPTAVGLWEQVDENSGRAESWFKITERNGVYEGVIVKIFFKPGEDENWTCDKCAGAERNAPVVGLSLIKGMRRYGNSYENGTIMDPRDGAVYRALMRLSPDGQRLEVRGYLGVSLFGRSQIWNRLPETALAPMPGQRAVSPPPKAAQPKTDTHKTASGTAFFVAKDGKALTNAHVVKGCREISVTMEGQRVAARILATDERNDWAHQHALHTVAS